MKIRFLVFVFAFADILMQKDSKLENELEMCHVLLRKSSSSCCHCCLLGKRKDEEFP